MKLPVGIIGIGKMGQHHLRVLSQMDDVEVVGVVDIDENAAKFAEKFSVEFSRDRKELLKKRPALIVIAVPTHLHFEVAMDAISYGVNVFVEKPITVNVNEARKLLKRASDEGVRLFVGHVERFNPAVRRLKELIEQKRFGDVHSIANLRVGSFRKADWDTGIILDLGTHDIDIISYLYGKKVQTVFAIGDRKLHTQEDLTSITLKFSDYESGYIELSWLTPYKVRKMFITGTEHFGLVDLIEQSIVIFDGKEWAKLEEPNRQEPLRLELEDVVSCIRKDLEPEVTPEDAIYTLDVAIGALKSLNSGTAVDFPQHRTDSSFPIKNDKG